MRPQVLQLVLLLALTISPAWASEPLHGEAHRLSAEAYAQVAEGEFSLAEDRLRAALALQPEHPQLLRQLADVLVRLQRGSEADEALTAVLQTQSGDPLVHLERGYVRYAAGRHVEAGEDFRRALQGGLDVDRERSARLAWADAALAAGQAEQVKAVLAPITAEDYPLLARRAAAQRALAEYEEAVASWRAAEAVSSDAAQRVTAIRSRVQILRDQNRDEEASREILEGVARYPDSRALMLDAAYLAVAVGDDETALSRFSFGAEDQDAPPHVLVDAAYVANRLGRSDEAARFFRMSIDRHYDDPETRAYFEPKQWFGMRRQIQEIEREFGFQAALFHRGNAFVPGVAGDDVLQASVEAFWQPQGIGYRGGRILQVFVRGIQTLSAPGLANSAETRLASFGARYKPIASSNLVLTAERVLGIGTLVEDDWLLRAGYSYDYGIDLQPWNRSWTTINGFVEAVRFVEAQRNVMGAQARAGRSFSFGDESWVLIPHLGLSLDYDSGNAARFAGGVGPGIALRYWYRGNRHWAPPSYVDLQLQYRGAFGEDDRSKGLAAQLIWYH